MLSRPARQIVTVGVFAAIIASSADAQPATLRGDVVHADARTPAVAVLIEVVDARTGVAGRTLTGSNGRFSLNLKSAGMYTVRALRVGYRPTVIRDMTVPDSGASVRIVLEEIAIRLNAARVTTDDKCGVLSGVQSGDGGVIATAWEEVRKALASADAAGSRGEFEAEVTNWYSVHVPNGESPIFQEFTRRTLDSPKPYVGVSGADVQRDGYARPAPGGAVDYLGPDAETLTSDSFAMTNCFRLVAPQPGRPWLGIAFRPPSSRVGYAIVEIEGTFWIDTTTSALRLLEYRYTNAPPAFLRVGAGGRIEFDQLATGAWIIRRWTIRLARDVVQRVPASAGRPAPSPYVAVSGGIVTSIRGDSEQLLAPAARSWRATFMQAVETAELDGSTVEFVEGGHFAAADSRHVAIVADPPVGKNTVLASTAVMRGLALPPLRVNVDVGPSGGETTIRIPGMIDLLRQRCGPAAESRREAAVHGVVQLGGRPLESTDIIAIAWVKDGERGAPAGQKWRTDSTTLTAGGRLDDFGEEVTPDTFGRWVACGVPRGSSVRVTVLDAGQRVAGVAFARVEHDARTTQVGNLVARARPE